MNQDKPLSRDERIAYGQALDETGRTASRAGAEMDEAVAAFLGVNTTDVRCLDVLDHYGSMTAGELAEIMALTTGAVTTMVDRLERIEYVTRTRDDRDRRRVNVALTPAMQHLAHALFDPYKDAWARHGRKMTDDELRAALTFTILSQELALTYTRMIREAASGSTLDMATRLRATRTLADAVRDIDVDLRREPPFPITGGSTD